MISDEDQIVAETGAAFRDTAGGLFSWVWRFAVAAVVTFAVAVFLIGRFVR